MYMSVCVYVKYFWRLHGFPPKQPKQPDCRVRTDSSKTNNIVITHVQKLYIYMQDVYYKLNDYSHIKNEYFEY